MFLYRLTQAASGDTGVPNPFALDGGGQPSADLAAPQRPPPPPGPTSSPAKSAFDDLNDSIRMALGGSPGRPQEPPVPQQQPQQQQQQAQQIPLQGFGQQQSFPANLGFGSPARQAIGNDETTVVD